MNYLKSYQTGGDYWQKLNVLFNALLMPPLMFFIVAYLEVRGGSDPLLEESLKRPMEIGLALLSGLCVLVGWWQYRKARQAIAGTFRERLNQYSHALLHYHLWLTLACLLLPTVIYVHASEFYAIIFMIPFAFFSSARPTWRRIRLGARLDREEWETLRRKEEIAL